MARKDTVPQVMDARFVAAARKAGELPAPAFAEVAFAGRSNVGKSSLINTLVGRRSLVRTSSTPGCTRAVGVYRVRLRDAVVDFVDLPGYGYAKRSKAERRGWGPLIEDFLAERPGLFAVIVIVDVRRGLEPDDLQLIEFLAEIGHAAIVVATKLDKLAPSKRKPALAAIERASGRRVLGFSATDRTGVGTLWRTLLREAHVEPGA